MQSEVNKAEYQVTNAQHDKKKALNSLKNVADAVTNSHLLRQSVLDVKENEVDTVVRVKLREGLDRTFFLI